MPPLIQVKLSLNERLDCLGTYDSGSNISVIHPKLLDKLNVKIWRLNNCKFKMVSGHGKILGITKIKVKIFDVTKFVYVFVLDSKDSTHDFIVGLDLIQEFRLRQDENLFISQSTTPVNLRRMSYNASINSIQIIVKLDNLSASERSSLFHVIDRFNYAFAKDKFDVGKISSHEAAVKLSEHRYIYRKPYRCNIVD